MNGGRLRKKRHMAGFIGLLLVSKRSAMEGKLFTMRFGSADHRFRVLDASDLIEHPFVSG